MPNERQILVLNPILDSTEDEDDELRGKLADAVRGVVSSTPISVENLSQGVKEFSQSLSMIFGQMETSFQGLEMKRVEVNATITASGKVSILAGGVEGGFQGGIKFVFEKD